MKRNICRLSTLSSLIVLSALAACGHDGGKGPTEGELITTVVLQWTAEGETQSFVFDDPDGDGGDPPVAVDPIELPAGAYDVQVLFENRLVSPAENITEEVADEASEHQVFFTGSAVNGPASDNPGATLVHSYEDEDALGLPIGLTNQVMATAGSGELVITLRHLPELAGGAQKNAETAAEVKDGGFSAIGGTSDVQVRFPVTILAP